MLVVQTTLKDRALAHERSPRPDRNALVGPLPDVLLDLWPSRAPDAPKLCDALWLSLLVATVALAATRGRRASLVIVRRAMLQTGVLYLLRGLTVGLTVLPRADPTCVNRTPPPLPCALLCFALCTVLLILYCSLSTLLYLFCVFFSLLYCIALLPTRLPPPVHESRHVQMKRECGISCGLTVAQSLRKGMTRVYFTIYMGQNFKPSISSQ